MHLGARLRPIAPRLAVVSLALLLLPLAPAESGAASAASQEGVRVDATTHAEVGFGRFVFVQGQELPRFIPTDQATMIPGESYGWRLRLRTTKATVVFREHVILPSPARSWGVTSDTVVAGDRASAVTTSRVAVPSHGILDHIWTFAEGDPRGLYRFDVAVEDTHVGSGSLHVR